MVIELNFKDIEQSKIEKAKQAVAASFANTAKAINIFAAAQIALIMKSDTLYQIDYENEVKYVKVTSKAIINSLKWHLDNLLKKDVQLAAELKKLIKEK